MSSNVIFLIICRLLIRKSVGPQWLLVSKEPLREWPPLRTFSCMDLRVPEQKELEFPGKVISKFPHHLASGNCLFITATEAQQAFIKIQSAARLVFRSLTSLLCLMSPFFYSHSSQCCLFLLLQMLISLSVTQSQPHLYKGWTLTALEHLNFRKREFQVLCSCGNKVGARELFP